MYTSTLGIYLNAHRILQPTEEALAGRGLQGTERAVSSGERKSNRWAQREHWFGRVSVGIRLKFRGKSWGQWDGSIPPLLFFLIKFTADLMSRPPSNWNSMGHGKKSGDKPELSVQNYQINHSILQYAALILCKSSTEIHTYTLLGALNKFQFPPLLTYHTHWLCTMTAVTVDKPHYLDRF